MKIVYAMIKSPKMCDMLYKAEKKWQSAERFKQNQESAILTLRQYKFEENEEKFVDQIHKVVIEQLFDDEKV